MENEWWKNLTKKAFFQNNRLSLIKSKDTNIYALLTDIRASWEYNLENWKRKSSIQTSSHNWWSQGLQVNADANRGSLTMWNFLQE